MGAPDVKNRYTFYLLFAIMGLLMFWLIHLYLGVIAFAFITVIILKPLYALFLRWCRGREKLAMTFTILVGLALPLFIFWVIGALVLAQAYTFIALIQQSNKIDLWADQIAAYIQSFFNSDVPFTVEMLGQVRQAVITVLGWIAGILVNLSISIPTMIVDLFVYLVLVGALLPNYERFVQWLKAISPLDDRLEDIFLRKINTTVQSMFAGIFLIAIVQGLAQGFFFWLAGLPYTPLWTLMAMLTATLPLGASIVAIPAAIAQFLGGHYTEGMIILAGYLLVVSNLDLLIRSTLVSMQAYGNFALVLLSLLGGYQIFGVFGIFYGPILLVLFLTMLDLYQTHFAALEEEVTASKGNSETRQNID